MTQPSPYDRLLAEELPTGTFGGRYKPDPVTSRPGPAQPGTCEEEAAQHAAVLEAETAAYDATHARAAARHLRPVLNTRRGAA